jgi:cysteine desulfurase/selenocysteine lyase
VIEAMDRFQRESYAPIHRGVYELAREATDAFEGAATRIASFVNWDPACSIFTRNATEAINLVAYAWGREHVGEGDEVLITEMEHHSNIVPWQLLCEETGAKLRYLTLTDSHELSLDELDAVLAEGPGEAGRGRARVERAGDDQPGRGDRPQGARLRRRSPS